MNNPYNDAFLEELCGTLSTPQDIKTVEKLEAQAKLPWEPLIADGLPMQDKQRFVSYFSQIGFLPKYKSYGVKYAAPFGYSMFDLKDNAGFSVQLHEQEKIEAFHILGTQQNSFLLLGSVEDWETHKEEFIALWHEGTPEESPLVYIPNPGDIALVESLNTVHTVIGCVLEEYATSSYDVVTRLHDQNKGDETVLPESHLSVAEVIEKAQTLVPKRIIGRGSRGWQEREIQDGRNLVNLSAAGLIGMHEQIGIEPVNFETPEDSVTTIVALQGETMVEIEDFQQIVPVGGTTALPPGTKCVLKNASIYDQARVSICQVRTSTAFADLRQLTKS